MKKTAMRSQNARGNALSGIRDLDREEHAVHPLQEPIPCRPVGHHVSNSALRCSERSNECR